MKCFLRANSPEIRKRLRSDDITVCICANFPQSEWLVHSSPDIPFSVHGVFPAEEDDSEKFYFGTKENFKEIFLEEHKDYIDCGEDIELFIRTIGL